MLIFLLLDLRKRMTLSGILHVRARAWVSIRVAVQKMNKKRIWVSLPSDIVEWLDQQIKIKRFKDYTYALDYVLTQFIKKEKES